MARPLVFHDSHPNLTLPRRTRCCPLTLVVFFVCVCSFRLGWIFDVDEETNERYTSYTLSAQNIGDTGYVVRTISLACGY